MEARHRRELEAARKAGVLPPELDAASGAPLNPHIPAFMASAPWYLPSAGPSLAHQRKADSSKPLLDEKTRLRGFLGSRATGYRPGACANCGSASHSARDCVERPRRKGAALTGTDIAADEVLIGGDSDKLEFEEKRDRWAGYDPASHAATVARYTAMEEERRRVRAAALAKEEEEKAARKAAAKVKGEGEGESGPGGQADADGGSTTDASDFGNTSDEDDAAAGSDDDVRASDAVSLQKAKADGSGPTMKVRNMRLREDKAVYLLNLDLNSAHYDPKARSMRENPTPDNPNAAFQGDNAWRTGESVRKVQQAQLFAWEAAAAGTDVHLNATPTQAELLLRQFQERKAAVAAAAKQQLAAAYGTSSDVNPADVPAPTPMDASEQFVTYTADGRVRSVGPASMPPPAAAAALGPARSRYEEDVYPGNHTSVWGSWWSRKERAWGFACCHSTHATSYCTGAAGKAARAASDAMGASAVATVASACKTADASSYAEYKAAAERTAGGKGGSGSTAALSAAAPAKPRAAAAGGDDRVVALDAAKLADAVARFEAAEAAEARGNDAFAGHKRKYNNVSAGGDDSVTPEEVEAWRLKRIRADDPMAAYIAQQRTGTATIAPSD